MQLDDIPDEELPGLDDDHRHQLEGLLALSDESLARQWALVMRALRHRELTRSGSQPVADLAEEDACRHLGLDRERKSNRGFDARDDEDNRYEIKSRRVTPWNNSRQLSFVRGLDEDPLPFDFLIAVIYDEMLSLEEMWKIPVAHLKATASYRERENAWRPVARGPLLDAPTVRVV